MTSNAAYADWIAVDWGTSHLRAWAMRDGAPRAEAVSDNGMAALQTDGFEAALLELIDPWLGAGRMPVLACGMVGARQGWAEAPYAPVPVKPLKLVSVAAPARDPRLDIGIVPGVSQATPADVMRGEETQIAGLIAGRPGFDGVVCLPGTHTKWAEISAGEIVSFRTFMTGELFALLSEKSVLRHTVGAGWDGDAFATAVGEAQSKPEMLAARLFSIRAEGLLSDLAGETARARLSGFLIGAELAAARPYWLGREIAVVGAPELARAYEAALRLQGAAPEVIDGQDMTRAGLSALRAGRA